MMMRQDTTNQESKAIVYEELESWVRVKIQGFIQDLLEEEVTELLGRQKHQRRDGVDAAEGYRNGYGKERKLSLSSGTIRVRRPRVRNLEERFESRILPLFVRRTKEVGELIPELYLHGLAQGDLELALRGLLGDGAPLSASSVGRLTAKWQVEFEQWQNRSLEGLEVVYLWVDGIYVKAGLEKEKACILVALAGLSDGSKVFVGLVAGYRESTESWSGLLRQLKQRGMNCPRLVIGDGHLGIWAALRQIWPEADEQRCWNHRILNILDKLPKKRQPQAKVMLKAIAYADSQKEAQRLKKVFQAWCRKHGCDPAAQLIDHGWEQMVRFYHYPKPHWIHLRTSNPVESPFSTVRLRTEASRRYKKVQSATAIIWKTLMVAETRFRRLNAPELLTDVFQGATYVDGVRVDELEKEVAA
jgi:transposase-like protein